MTKLADRNPPQRGDQPPPSAGVSLLPRAVELIRVRMPLVAPFRTSHGIETARDVLVVHLITDAAEGWSECVAMAEPLYSPEYVDGAQRVIVSHLLPRLFARGAVAADEVAGAMAPVRGHRMAKAAVETAWLDAGLRAAGRSLASYLGATRDRVDSGVAVGIMDSIPELLETVQGYVEAGYRRVKLKIEPGWDVAPVAAVRERFGPELPLQVDANAAYTLADAEHLARLDAFSLLLIEQPLPEDQLLAHARLAERVRTPICLDESIVSAVAAEEAIALKACAIVNIKPGRVGGYIEARRVHDVCRAAGIPVWCGGMLETGIGRAANLALAALPGFLLPGDTSASERYYREDITAPFLLEDGRIAVPQGLGIGVEPRCEVLDRLATATELVRPD